MKIKRIRAILVFFLLSALIVPAIAGCSGGAGNIAGTAAHWSTKETALANLLSAVEEQSRAVLTTANATLSAYRTAQGVHAAASWTQENAFAFLAVYNQDGKMLEAAADNGGGVFDLTCDPESAEYVKLFLLDQNFQPLASALTQTVSASAEPGRTLQTAGALVEKASLTHLTDNPDAPLVYFTPDITSESLMAAYDALNWTPTGKVAVKISSGEPPASNYLRPELIRELVQSVNGVLVETNTAYGGRASTAMHLQAAKDHGFTDIAEVDIMDADGEMTLPVTGGSRLRENVVGSHYERYGSFLILSHFKGHPYGGFGGAIKNTSIGIASREGKALIHTGGASRNSYYGAQNPFLEAMAEAAKSVSDDMNHGEKIVYVNVMNRISVDCDCLGNPAEPDMHDIGILASHDPVALDQACVDLIYAVPDGQSVINRIESRNGSYTLEHAEKIGLGSRTYRLAVLPDAESGATPKEPEAGQDGTADGKTLIAYFSRTGENYNVGVIQEGNTAKFAKEIAAQTGGDLFEIVPVTPYPGAYSEMLTIATNERNNNARPAIKNAIPNFSEYDTVFIGYPIWWGDLPMILHTFMESYDFTGKTIIPFNTHEGSGQSGTQRAVADKLSGATVLQGLAMRGSDAQNLNCDGTDASVRQWLEGLGYHEEGQALKSVYDFSGFSNVELLDADLSTMDAEQAAVLRQQMRFCQAMTEADIETMRQIVSEDTVFTHMSGRQQTREEYFEDVKSGALRYFTIGIERPVVAVNGDTASIEYTSVLNANAYGARGTYRIAGTHWFERRDGEWFSVNAPNADG